MKLGGSVAQQMRWFDALKHFVAIVGLLVFSVTRFAFFGYQSRVFGWRIVAGSGDGSRGLRVGGVCVVILVGREAEGEGGMEKVRTSAVAGQSLGRETMGRIARIQQTSSCLRGCRRCAAVFGVLSIRG